MQVPKKLLRSKYRKEMYGNCMRILKKIQAILPISSAYLLESFTTKKNRPADVDLVVLLKTKQLSSSNWSLDMVISPDNEFGNEVLKDAELWMKQKYGAKKHTIIKVI